MKPQRTSSWRPAVSGAVVGFLATVVGCAPAHWLADALNTMTEGRLVLASPQGSLWEGSARLSFSGGAGSHDAAALPGRVTWQLRPGWQGLTVRLAAPCCAPLGLGLDVVPRWGGVQLNVADAPAGTPSHWPAALLSGLGTPWNTLQAEGDLQLSHQGLRFEVVQGRVSVAGAAQIEARHMSSRLSTLRPMGSYRFSIAGGPVTTLQLETLEGSLRLSGSGLWAGTGLRFEGFATAEPEREAALSNLLNIIGRRDGARSIITVG